MSITFNPSVKETLVGIIGTDTSGLSTPSGWVEDPIRCRNRLYDIHPHDRLEVELLYRAHQGNVPNSLTQAKRTEESESLVPLIEAKQIASAFQRRNGLTQDAARWAVGVWADALGIRIPNRKSKFDSPSIVSFEATTDPSSASSQQQGTVTGTPVRLQWEVWGDHDQIKLTPPDARVDPRGEKYVGVDEPTTFELEVERGGETLHESVTAGPHPPAIHDLEAEFQSYVPGEQAVIAWGTNHEDALRLQPGSQEVTGANQGTVTVSDVDPMSVVLHAFTDGGMKTKKSITLRTVQIRTFRHHSLNDPNKYELEWDVANASRVTLDGEAVDDHQAHRVFSNSSGMTTHVLRAYADSGASCKDEIRLEPCSIQKFDADQTTGIAGTPITLTWQVEGAESVKLDDGVQIRDVTGREQLELRLRRGERKLRLFVEGKANRDVTAMEVQGLTGDDVVHPVEVPDIPLNVGVDDVAPTLDDVRLPVASFGTSAIATEQKAPKTDAAETEFSLGSILAEQQRKLQSHDEEIRAITEESQSLPEMGKLASSWRRITSWVRREAKLFGIVPKATWKQVRSIVQRGISIFR